MATARKMLGLHYDEADRISKEISEFKALLSQQEEELRHLREYQVDEETRPSSTYIPHAEKRSAALKGSKLDQLQKRITERSTEIERLKVLMTTLFAEQAVTVAETDDSEQLKKEEIVYRERPTFVESYSALSKTQQGYCDSLRAYAVKQSGAKEVIAKYHISVGSGKNAIVKIIIKNGVVCALFRLEDERLRRLRRNAVSDGTEIKIKETIISIDDGTAFRVAKEMVDLKLVQLEEDIVWKKQRAAERRKAARHAAKQ